MTRSCLTLIAILCLSGCNDRQMSAECKAVLKLTPSPLWGLENNTKVASDGTLDWAISQFNPGHLPLLVDVSTDTSGLATAPLVEIEPGSRELVFAGTTNASVTSLEIAVPRLAFTLALPAVSKNRSPITLLFPVDPALATISQSPQDGAGFMRARSHTAARGGQHEAVDIDAPLGTPIVAPADGLVARAFDASPDVRCNFASHIGHANYLILVTDDDVSILLSHLKRDSILVEAGMRVRRGERIAQVGQSGSGDRSHIHLVAMALGLSGVDSIPIRFAACAGEGDAWTPRNGRPCR